MHRETGWARRGSSLGVAGRRALDHELRRHRRASRHAAYRRCPSHQSPGRVHYLPHVGRWSNHAGCPYRYVGRSPRHGDHRICCDRWSPDRRARRLRTSRSPQFARRLARCPYSILRFGAPRSGRRSGPGSSACRLAWLHPARCDRRGLGTARPRFAAVPGLRLDRSSEPFSRQPSRPFCPARSTRPGDITTCMRRYVAAEAPRDRARTTAHMQTRAALHRGERPSFRGKCPATSYSPTPSPGQYHRRREA